MNEMILVYITCESKAQAKAIGLKILKKRLAACIKVIPDTFTAFYWPPKSGKIVETTESVLLVKTLQAKYLEIELEVRNLHTDKTPCILTFEIAHVNQDYYEWLKGELNQ